MKRKGLSQEGLKLIACAAMLLDHIGAVLVPGDGLRIIGRIAFPIYCFLLSEGIYYTKDPRKYGLRLLVGLLLAEVPFDMLLFGELTWAHSSVMVTLMLGFLYGEAAKRVDKLGHKLLLMLPFMAVASFLGSDYGAVGVAVIGMFLLTREMPGKRLVQTLGLAVACYVLESYPVWVGSVPVPIEMFAVLAMVPITLYDGRKLTCGKAVQTIFYLFYPVHLAVLLLIVKIA